MTETKITPELYST